MGVCAGRKDLPHGKAVANAFQRKRRVVDARGRYVNPKQSAAAARPTTADQRVCVSDGAGVSTAIDSRSSDNDSSVPLTH